jgi:hypothetical protein
MKILYENVNNKPNKIKYFFHLNNEAPPSLLFKFSSFSKFNTNRLFGLNFVFDPPY